MKWAMIKKDSSEVMIQAVMSWYDGAKTRVKMGSAYTEEFEEWLVWPLLCAIIVGIIIKKKRKGVVNEIPYANDLVCMSKTIADLKKSFWNKKDALESKGLKVNIRKTKLMVNGLGGEE